MTFIPGKASHPIEVNPNRPAFNEYFQGFLEQVFETTFPVLNLWRSEDLNQSVDDAHRKTVRRSGLLENELLAWMPRSVIRKHEDDITTLNQKATKAVDLLTAHNLTEPLDKFEISYTDLFQENFNEDLVFVKINHGYWEQSLALYLEYYDPKIIRVNSRYRYVEDYQKSYFCRALNTLLQKSGQVDNGILSFPGVSFALSFGNGDLDHSEVVKKNQNVSLDGEVRSKIFLGALHGANLTFGHLFDANTYKFFDGAWAKKSLSTKRLSRTMDKAAELSDNILFVVPPHLKDITLVTPHPVTQQTFFVSGTRVHKSWSYSLMLSANLIYEALLEGRTITVITQSAVFSALLGFFAKQMKSDLKLPGKLFYFDLGQVLDTANPATSNKWALTKKLISKPVFECINLPPIGQ